MGNENSPIFNPQSQYFEGGRKSGNQKVLNILQERQAQIYKTKIPLAQGSSK